jgi:hypothetical protein
MTQLWRLISEESFQYIVFLSLSVIVIFLTGITYISNSSSFQRFFGRFNPLLAVSIVFILGLILFSFLLSDGQFAIYKRGNFKGILLAIGLAVPFAAVILLFDWKIPFPIDMNVTFPDSLMFYPAMGYVVQILFFILPFCLIYFILGTLVGESNKPIIIWGSILIVALIEPIFQINFMQDQNPIWATAFVGLHIFLLSLVQLLLFRRYDFITMYSFRLSYYLLWHIIWGHLRLYLLF